MSALRFSRLRVVFAAVVVAVCVQAWLGAPLAFGQDDPAAAPPQNPELSVSLQLPEKATQGQTVAATVSITNNSGKFQTIVIKGVWLDPTGDATVTTRNGMLLPGQTVTRVVDYTIDERSLPGLHEVTVSVEGRGGASTATAIVEVS